jgi:sigma-B regulation protein RsbQ
MRSFLHTLNRNASTEPLMNVYEKNNVRVFGHGAKTIVFAHGFGCDQTMWRWVAPAFLSQYRIVLFDQIGAGQSDASQYSPDRYTSLDAYADDILAICDALALDHTILVGHSVAATICMLAAIRQPKRFSHLIMVAPSVCYINQGGYVGGFEADDLHAMLDTLTENLEAWAYNIAPAIVGNPDRPELSIELAESFCRFHPVAARQFARLTFLSDNRTDLPNVRVPTLILQCSKDMIAPETAGRYIHACISGSTYVELAAMGHCPNLSAPTETIGAISHFLDSAASAPSQCI